MGWRVLGVDLNRSESTGTLARAIPWGRLNVVEKEKLRLDVSVGDGTSGKVQLFSRINPGPIKAWRLRLRHLLPRRRGSRWLSFPPLCSARGWDCASSSGFPIGQFEPAVNVRLIASGIGPIV
jgi:hypothetical protein